MAKKPVKPKRPRKTTAAATSSTTAAAATPKPAAAVAPPADPLLGLEEICSAEYLRSLPEGLNEIRVPMTLIHSLLLKYASIPLEDLQRALANMADPPPPPRADERGGPRTTEAEALEAAVMAALPAEIVERIYDRFDMEGCHCPAHCDGVYHIDEFEQHCMEHVEHDVDPPKAGAAAAAPALAAAANPSIAAPAPSAAAATTAAPPTAAGPPARQLALPADATSAPAVTPRPAAAPPAPPPAPPDADPAVSPTSAAAASAAPPPSPSPAAGTSASASASAASSGPPPSQPQQPAATVAAGAVVPVASGVAASIHDSITWLAEGADWDDEEPIDVMDGLEELSPMPEFLEDSLEIVLRIPPKQLPGEGDADEDDGLDALLEWLYFDVEQAIKEKWGNLLLAFKKTNKRINELNPRIERREHILRIRGQIASEYQRRLAAMVPTGDQEQHRRRMYVEEVSCLATVTHHYLAITRYRIAALRRNMERSLQVSRRMQENIAEFGRQAETHQREIERLDANELRLIKEELALAQEGGAKAGKRRAQRALDAEKNRQTKDELLKKVDSCQRRASTMRDKYCRMLKTCLQKRERVTAQEKMESTLARLHSQSLLSLHEYDPDSYPAVQLQVSAGPLGRPLTTQDLQPILDFEKQETEALDTLMDEHASQVDARAQVFELMRELAYTDPFVKVLKEATLKRLDQMAADDRQRRKELARVLELERAAQRVAIQRALLEDEAEAQRKAQEKERERAKILARAKQQQLVQKESQKKAARVPEEKAAPPPVPAPAVSAVAPLIISSTHAVILPEAPVYLSPEPESLEYDDYDGSDQDDLSDSDEEEEERVALGRRDRRRDRGPDGKQKQRPLCRDNLRGCCPRGAACAWLHLDSSAEVTQPVCKDFQRGICYREPCAFLHVSGSKPKSSTRGRGASPPPTPAPAQAAPAFALAPAPASSAASTAAVASASTVPDAARPAPKLIKPVEATNGVPAATVAAVVAAGLGHDKEKEKDKSLLPTPSADGKPQTLAPPVVATRSANISLAPIFASAAAPPAAVAPAAAAVAPSSQAQVSAASLTSTLAAPAPSTISATNPAPASAPASFPAAVPTESIWSTSAALPKQRSGDKAPAKSASLTVPAATVVSTASSSSSLHETGGNLHAPPPPQQQHQQPHQQLQQPHQQSARHVLVTADVDSMFSGIGLSSLAAPMLASPSPAWPSPGRAARLDHAPQPRNHMGGMGAPSPHPGGAFPPYRPFNSTNTDAFAPRPPHHQASHHLQQQQHQQHQQHQQQQQHPSLAYQQPPRGFTSAPAPVRPQGPPPASYAQYGLFSSSLFGSPFGMAAPAASLPGFTPWSSAAPHADSGWAIDGAVSARFNDAYVDQAEDGFELNGLSLDDHLEEQAARLLSEDHGTEEMAGGAAPELECGLVPSTPLDDSLDVFLRAFVELLRYTPGLKEMFLGAKHPEHKSCVFCALRTTLRYLQLGYQARGVTVEQLRAAIVQMQLPLVRPGHFGTPGQMVQEILQAACRSCNLPPGACVEFCPVHRIFGRVSLGAEACPKCHAACILQLSAVELARDLRASQPFHAALHRPRGPAKCSSCHHNSELRLPSSGTSLTVALNWEKPIAPDAALLVVSNIEPRLLRPDNSHARLCAMLCQRGVDFHVFVYQPTRGAWLLFPAHEGGPARPMGQWEDVQHACHRENLLPSLLVYETRPSF